jgi:hypothetical protein
MNFPREARWHGVVFILVPLIGAFLALVVPALARR